MQNTVYKINKGINKPVEFKGLQAQYILYLAIGTIVLVFVFAILHAINVNTYVCVTTILSFGFVLFIKVHSTSKKYGKHGLMKKLANRRSPTILKSRSRKMFLNNNKRCYGTIV